MGNGEMGSGERVQIVGGEGIGKQVNHGGAAAIYGYAQRLLRHSLEAWLAPEERIRVTVILPEGRSLALRTSNAAFGVVEGLSLLGTSGIAQPLSSPDQLEEFRAALQAKAERFEALIFCIGENGLDLAPRWGLPSDRLVKTANWLGPLLVEAGLCGVKQILLFGYHGKLLKLAGGIFHTHNHVADARLEILAAHAAIAGLDPASVTQIFHSPTAEAALTLLQQHPSDVNWTERVYGAIAQQIDSRATAYIRKYCESPVQVGCWLFDRQRQSLIRSPQGHSICYTLMPSSP